MAPSIVCRVRKIRALAVLTSVLSGGPCFGAQNADVPAFPVPRAEKDFSTLLPDLQGYCSNVTKGNEKAFIIALSADGPLDLQVNKAQSPAEARSLRDFQLGVSAAASAMPPQLADRLGKPFQSAPADVQRREQNLVKQLPQIEAFVKRFKAVPRITLLAQWGFTDEFRVNNMFHMLGRDSESIPSPVMGFVPSGQWKSYKSPQDYLDTLHVSRSTFDGLYKAFQPLLVVAARRTEGGGVAVIGLGIATNTSGLLFVPKGAPDPVVGRSLPDGSKYSVVEQVKPGVFYFETA